MAIEHLKQSEVYTSETTNDSVDLTTFAPLNIQDDLNVIRTILKSIIGGTNFKDIANIYTLKNLYTWRNTHFTSFGLKATSIDVSVVADVDNFRFVLSNNSYWQKLKSFAQQYLNTQNKVLWSGIAYTATELDNAISTLPVITSLQTNVSSLQTSVNSLQTNQSIFFQEIYGSVVSSSSGNQPILNRISALESQVSSLSGLPNLSNYINVISQEIYGYFPPPGAPLGTDSILTRLNTVENDIDSLQNNISQVSQIQTDLQNLRNKVSYFDYNTYIDTINNINTNINFLNFASQFGVKEKLFLDFEKLKVLDLDRTLKNFIESQTVPDIILLLNTLKNNDIAEVFIPYRYIHLISSSDITLIEKIKELLDFLSQSSNLDKFTKITILIILNRSTTQDESELYSQLPQLIAKLLPYVDVALQVEENFDVWTDFTYSSTTTVPFNAFANQVEKAIKYIYEKEKSVKVFTNNPKFVLSRLGLYNLEIFSPVQFYWPVNINGFNVKIDKVTLFDNAFDVDNFCAQFPPNILDSSTDNTVCDLIFSPSFQGVTFDVSFDTNTNNYTSPSDIEKLFAALSDSVKVSILTNYLSPYKVFSPVSIDTSNPLDIQFHFSSVKSGFFKLYRKLKMFNKDSNNFPTTEVGKNASVDEFYDYYLLDTTNSSAIIYESGIKDTLIFATSLGENFEVEMFINGYDVYNQSYSYILKLSYDASTGNLTGYDNSNNAITVFSKNIGTSGLGIFKVFLINNNGDLDIYLGNISDIVPPASPKYTISNMKFDGSINIILNFTGTTNLKIKVLSNDV
ncbi:wac fibritin neck whisker [Thermus phage TMA]|uniref:wac fibritin neck whisker n=1 Tax=Thermus phage TMA TaxID=699370 RepID=UPI00021AAE02|nr:wac fibritin neck whisker [Thermus phage TMA]BAK53838.1 wac fibritin neck whisker [Thermus phage TMA]